MSISEERFIELASELDRVKVRLARVERGQAILVISSDELNTLAKQSGKSHPDCLYALRESGGNLKDAATFLEKLQ